MVSSMYEKTKLDDYGILETFSIVKIGTYFGVLEGVTQHYPLNTLSSYAKMLNTMQKDNLFVYIYVHQKKGSQKIPNLNKNIVISNDPFHFFLMDEMENGFKNRKLPLSQSEKTKFCRFLSDFITIEKKIPTIKDFTPGSMLLICKKNEDWTLEIKRNYEKFYYSVLAIEGRPERWYSDNRENLIHKIKVWITEGVIDSNLDDKDVRPILRLLKYFVDYDYEQDKDEAVAKEYFTEKEIDHLNKVIDRWANGDKRYAPERFVHSLKPVLKEMIKEIKIGSLDDD